MQSLLEGKRMPRHSWRGGAPVFVLVQVRRTAGLPLAGPMVIRVCSHPGELTASAEYGLNEIATLLILYVVVL